MSLAPARRQSEASETASTSTRSTTRTMMLGGTWVRSCSWSFGESAQTATDAAGGGVGLGGSGDQGERERGGSLFRQRGSDSTVGISDEAQRGPPETAVGIQ